MDKVKISPNARVLYIAPDPLQFRGAHDVDAIQKFYQQSLKQLRSENTQWIVISFPLPDNALSDAELVCAEALLGCEILRLDAAAHLWDPEFKPHHSKNRIFCLTPQQIQVLSPQDKFKLFNYMFIDAPDAEVDSFRDPYGPIPYLGKLGLQEECSSALLAECVHGAANVPEDGDASFGERLAQILAAPQRPGAIRPSVFSVVQIHMDDLFPKTVPPKMVIFLGNPLPYSSDHLHDALAHLVTHQQLAGVVVAPQHQNIVDSVLLNSEIPVVRWPARRPLASDVEKVDHVAASVHTVSLWLGGWDALGRAPKQTGASAFIKRQIPRSAWDPLAWKSVFSAQSTASTAHLVVHPVHWLMDWSAHARPNMDDSPPQKDD